MSIISQVQEIRKFQNMPKNELAKFEALSHDSNLIDRMKTSLVESLGNILGNKKAAKESFENFGLDGFEEAFESRKFAFAQKFKE